MTDVVNTGRVNPSYGAKILDGYDPDEGTWDAASTIGRLLTVLRTGCSIASAAAYAKTTGSSVYRWREAGRMFMADMDLRDRLDLDLGERVFVDFASRMDEVLGTFEVEMATIVRNGARDNPQLALTVLGRRFPHWREQKAVEVSSGEGAVVQDRLAALLLANPTLASKAEEFAMALEAVGGVSDEDIVDAELVGD
jgi:hypothetical protein